MNQQQIHYFLFPHQDDEFGVFHLLETIVARGHRPVCFYLTDGSYGGADPATRDMESSYVLSALGMQVSDIIFLGSTHCVPDGQLVSYLPDVFSHLKKAAEAFGSPDFIYVPAWEGGHQDHDAAHALGIVAAAHWGSRLRQFPLYTAGHNWLRLYRVLAPVARNGPIESMRIPAARRIWYLRLCLSYRTQAKTFAALLPFIVAHYVLWGAQQLQEVDPARLSERPHEGSLFYERYRGLTFDGFKSALNGFLDAHQAVSGTRKT